MGTSFGYLMDTWRFGFIYIGIGMIPIAVLLLYWMVKHFLNNDTSNFWRGYWVSLWVVLSEIVYDKVYSKVRCDLRIDSIVVQLFV